jgi:hypothetical protein
MKGTGTLLLVEDETPLRMLAATSLKKIEHTAHEAGNGNRGAGRSRGAWQGD